MKSTKMMYKRILAFVLALVMMGSTFMSASVSAYATTGADDVTVEVETVEDAQEEIVEESEDEATVEKTETIVENVEVEDVDTEEDVDAEEDVNAETDANTEADADVETDADTEVDVNTEVETDVNADAEVTVSDNDIDEATVSENEIELMSADGYIGEIETWDNEKYLYIDIYDIVDYNDWTTYTISEEAVLDILQANEGKTFKGICITPTIVSNDPPAIYDDVVAKAATMINDNGYVEFYYPIEESASLDVIIWGPDTVQSFEAEVIDVDTSISGGKGYLTFTSIPDIAADEVAVQVVYDDYSEYPDYYDYYKPWITAYGKDYIPIKLAKDSVYVEEIGGYYQVSSWAVRVYISDISSLEAGVPYEVCDSTYKGSVENNILTVDLDELVEAEGWPYDYHNRIAEVINAYGDSQKFDAIKVTVEDYNRYTPDGKKLPQYTIDSAIYNAAVNHLKSDAQGEERGLYYTINQEYYDEDDNLVENGFTTWHFANPTKVTKDIVIGYDISVPDTGFVNVTFNTPSTLGKTIVNVTDTFNGAYHGFGDLVDALSKLDEEVALYPVETRSIGFDWETADDSLTISMSNDVSSLVDNKTYTVRDKYIGHIGDGDWGKHLYISAGLVGKDVFAAGELEDYLQNWADQGPFNSIYIEQRDSEDGDNVIRKADFNAAHALLAKDESHTEITFNFDDTEVDEWEGNYYVYPDYIDWTFHNPSTATADMKAGLEVDEYGANGLSIKRASATYPSKEVVVTLAKDYCEWEDVFGYDIPVEGTEDFEPLQGLIFSNIAKLTDVNSELYYWRSISEEDEYQNVYRLQVCNTQNLPTTECYAFPVKTDEYSPYAVGEVVGEEYGLSISGNIALKSYDPDIAYASSTKSDVSLTVVKEGYFTYAHAYTQNSETVVDVYRAEAATKLKEMKIINHPKVGEGQYKVVMELPPENEDWWEATDGLDLRLYPDSAGQYWDDLNWELVNENPDKPAIEWTEYHGFKALNPGNATITVSYTPNGESVPTHVVTCFVEVKKSIYDDLTETNWEKIFEDGQPIAIMNYDKTLADVELPIVNLEDEGVHGTLKWLDPTTALSTYAGMQGHEFPATYTSDDGRTAKVNLWVDFVSVDSLIVESSLVDTVIQKGEIFTFEPKVKMSNYAIEVVEGENSYHTDELSLSDVKDLFAGCELNVDLSFVVKEGKTELTANNEGVYEYSSDKPGKKTFTISLMASVNEAKAKELKKTSFAVTVPKNDVVNLEDLILWKVVSNEKDGLIGEEGTYYFAIPAESNFKLTAKNLATDVAKWGKTTNDTFKAEEMPEEAWSPENPEGYVGNLIEGTPYNYVAVPYTIIGEGFVRYSLTANDEVKTSTGTMTAKEYIDYLPRPQVSTATINSKTISKAAGLTWELEEGTSVGELTLSGKDADKFVITAYPVEGSILPVGIELKQDLEEPVKNGKYKLTVETEVNVEGRAEPLKFATEITVTVTDKLPNVTVKQNKNVNLFYNDAEGDGLLTVTSDATIKNVNMQGQKGAALDYKLDLIEDNGNSRVYAIKWDSAEGKNTKAELIVTFAAYEAEVSKTLNIKKENKAPVVTLSKKSDTLYTNYIVGNGLNSEIHLTVNGEPVNLSEVKFGSKGDQDIVLSGVTTVLFKNNTYGVEVRESIWEVGEGTDSRNATIIISADPLTAKKSTDKFVFQVKEANWTKPVSINYSVKVDTSVPKLELGTKTITLNRNDALFANQSVATTLQLKGGGVNLFAEELFGDENNDTGYWISYVGKDAKSIKYMANDLIINYNEDGLIVRLHDNSIPKGTYKYDIKLNNKDNPAIVATLTVKIVEDAPEKCITVSGKGNIDVLDREGTSVAYTAKLKNIAGKVVDGDITGADSDKFYAEFEDGKLVVKARDGVMFNTKTGYKVTPVFIIENAEGGSFNLEGKEQSIKVKQGKPKVTMTSVVGNILYRGRTNELAVNLDALLNKTKDVAINHVELAGNWDTFYISSVIGEFDEYGNPTDITGLTISQHDYPGTIINNGKTVNLKFNVYFTDAAGNEKATSVTYKMVVK